MAPFLNFERERIPAFSPQGPESACLIGELVANFIVRSHQNTVLGSGKRAAASLAVLVVALSMQGCQQREKLSAEQREHYEDVDRCVRVRAEAGQSIFGTLSKDCEDMHPDRPTVERRKLMALMEKKALIPADIQMPVLLPDGDCKVISLRYVELQEIAYRHDADQARAESLAEAERIWTAINAGSCVMPKRSGGSVPSNA